MGVAACDHGLLGGLFGDEEIARHLDARAEIASMILFEAALARVEARLGIIPAEAGPAISMALDGLEIKPADLAVATVSAGVAAPGLVKTLRERVGPPHGQFLHWGATSQDAVDTGLVLRLRVILACMKTRLRELVDHLAVLAKDHSDLQMAGRTRSQIATPTTFGLRVAGWLCPLARCLERLDQLSPRLLIVQLGGATGNLSVFGENGIPVMEELAAELSLGCPAKPWHVERDGLVELANWLSMVSGLLGRIGADLILLGRSEIGEVATGTGGGSSTMPQKQNPVLAEALVTLARSNGAQAGLAQQALLQTEERDGSAWAVEWLCLPQMLIATAAGLRMTAALMADLYPVPERMTAALNLNGGAANAEALAFAMAEHMPLPNAQAIVKQAAEAQRRRGGTLAEQVSALCAAQGMPTPMLDPSALLATSRALIRRAVGDPC